MSKKRLELSSAGLHILAMFFMLCDHIWVTKLAEGQWLTCVGRLAFPIYAFLLVEGYFHTGNLRKYVVRLLICAVLSEIPFNMMAEGALLYPGHQNVIWTFLISILVIHGNERAKELTAGARFTVLLLTLLAGFALALYGAVDYGYGGVFTVFAFYLFRGKRRKDFLGQLLLLAYINLEVLEGFQCTVSAFGTAFSFPGQMFALLSLLPIWLYGGKQGLHNRGFRSLCYGFYPLHLLILSLLRMYG